MLPTSSWAACNYSKEILKDGDRFSYSKNCHIEFGETLNKVDKYEEVIPKYKEEIRLTEEQLKLERDRALGWENAYESSNKKYKEILDNEKQMKYYWFVGGFLLPVILNYSIKEGK